MFVLHLFFHRHKFAKVYFEHSWTLNKRNELHFVFSVAAAAAVLQVVSFVNKLHVTFSPAFHFDLIRFLAKNINHKHSRFKYFIELKERESHKLIFTSCHFPVWIWFLCLHLIEYSENAYVLALMCWCDGTIKWTSIQNQTETHLLIESMNERMM